MTVDDAQLVALIDNELDEEAKSRLLAQLAADEGLRRRYEALRDAGAPVSASFDALLERAPLSRLRAALPLEAVARPASSARQSIAFRELAAGFVVGLLAAGLAAWIAWSLARPGEKNDWLSAVAGYTSLYTNLTFPPPPEASLEGQELALMGGKVGANLTPETMALPGLRFSVAFLLSFKGSPLAAIALVDPDGAPVLFCVIANGEADSPMRLEKREGLQLATWSRDGRGYVVIGRQPESRIAELAQTLEKRI
jgi:anti-sigma factor RsiW